MQMTEELGGSFTDLVLPDDPDKIFELGNAVGSGFVVFRINDAHVLPRGRFPSLSMCRVSSSDP